MCRPRHPLKVIVIKGRGGGGLREGGRLQESRGRDCWQKRLEVVLKAWGGKSDLRPLSFHERIEFKPVIREKQQH